MKYIILVVGILIAQVANAEFTLDDFDTEFSLFRPLERLAGVPDEVWHFDFSSIVDRRRVVLGDTRPGLIEATATFKTGDSVAVGELLEVPPRVPGVTQYTGFGFNYFFVGTGQDISEDNANNAVFIDFAFLRGPTPPKHITLDVVNSANWGFAWMLDLDLPETEDGFTFVVPFGKFQDRVLRPISLPPDFSDAALLNVAIYGSGRFDLDTYDPAFEEQFAFGIDAIRIGHVDVDFNGDEAIDVQDVNRLVEAIVSQTEQSSFDLSQDGEVDTADLDLMLAFAAHDNRFASPLLSGDANLDGTVDVTDLTAVGQNWLGSPNSWEGGDFNADGIVDSLDLNPLGQRWQRSVPSPDANVASVPEPGTFLLLTFLAPVLIFRRELF